MTCGTRAAPEKAPLDAYERKMGRQRSAFLNQSTLDNIAREYRIYVGELREEPNLGACAKSDGSHEA